MGKKRKAEVITEQNIESKSLPSTRISDEPVQKKVFILFLKLFCQILKGNITDAKLSLTVTPWSDGSPK